MSAAPYVVGGLLIGGVLIGAMELRRRAAATAGGAAPPTGSPCDKLQAFGPYAYAYCKAGEAVKGIGEKIWGGIDHPGESSEDDANNIALNGGVDLPLTAEVLARTAQVQNNTSSAGGPLLFRGSAIRYKNGGVPFNGFPGYEKCAPGTKNMRRGAYVTSMVGRFPQWDAASRTVTFAAFAQNQATVSHGGSLLGTDTDGVNAAWSSSLALSGHLGDPFTFVVSVPADALTGWKVVDATGKPFTPAPPLVGKTFVCYIAGRRYEATTAGQVIELENIVSALDTRTGERIIVVRPSKPGERLPQSQPANRPPGSHGGALVEQHYTTGPRVVPAGTVVREH